MMVAAVEEINTALDSLLVRLRVSPVYKFSADFLPAGSANNLPYISQIFYVGGGFSRPILHPAHHIGEFSTNLTIVCSTIKALCEHSGTIFRHSQSHFSRSALRDSTSTLTTSTSPFLACRSTLLALIRNRKASTALSRSLQCFFKGSRISPQPS